MNIDISKGDINEYLWFQRMLEARLHEPLRFQPSLRPTLLLTKRLAPSQLSFKVQPERVLL